MVGSRFRVARRHQHSISRPSCAMPVALLCAVLAIGVMCDARVCAQATSPVPPALPSGTPSTPTFRTEIVVTPERSAEDRARLPVSTALLTRMQIDQLPATSLADVMQALPGFHMLLGADSGLPPAPLARGFFGGGEAEYVKLLVDGIPVGDAESGLVNWRSLPAFAIDRIEALRGPASGVYGDTALAGVVQAFTVRPHARLGRVDVSGGSFGSRTLGGTFSEPFGNAVVDVIGSYGAADGFRARSAFREAFGSTSFRHASDARQWTARGSFNYLARDDPGALTAQQLSSDRSRSDALFGGDRDTNRRGHGALRFASQTGPLSYGLLGYVSARTGERVRTLLLAPGMGDRAHRDISSTTAGASLENSVNTSFMSPGGHLRFGVDLSRSATNSTYRAVDRDNRPGRETGSFAGARWQFAGYAAQSVDLGARARLQGGVRWDGLEDRLRDRTRAFHGAWSPRFGATVLVIDSARPIIVFGQLSRAFKAATVDQLFDPRPFPDFRGGSFLVSNPALEPQRALNLEGGIRQTGAQFRWELVGYRMSVKNEIDFDPATFTYANIRRSTHTGAEVEAVVFERSRVSARVTYGWTRVLPDEPSPETLQLKNIPRHLFRPEITVTVPRGAIVHVRYTRTAGAFADDQNAFPLRDRSTLDVRLAKRVRRVTARLDLLNVTDAEHEEVGFTLADFRGGIVPFYYPAQGFSIRAGLELALDGGQ
jgi:outer membrane receptor protein involved in Fe transport